MSTDLKDISMPDCDYYKKQTSKRCSCCGRLLWLVSTHLFWNFEFFTMYFIFSPMCQRIIPYHHISSHYNSKQLLHKGYKTKTTTKMSTSSSPAKKIAFLWGIKLHKTLYFSLYFLISSPYIMLSSSLFPS